jgi:murein DD-endopeptidase MepM/ murein hydrolase activator NlpD
MENVIRQSKTSPFGPISARQAYEADLFFEELTGVATGMREREYRPTASAFSYDGYGEGVAMENDFQWYNFADETVTMDTAAAIPHFTSREKTNVLTPLLSASHRTTAVNWNNLRHSGRSGVTKAEIRNAVNNYVDFSAIARAMSSGTTTISSNSDEALVEGIHQFQKKCYLNASQVDGKAGESTLDSLGLIARTGLRTVNRANSGRAAFLQRKSADIRRLSSNEFSHSTWFNFMVNPSFLGYRFTNGVHLHFVRALRVAERYLLSLSAYAGKTPVQIGRALGINEIHKGARPTATSRSMHTLGLATDINYLTCPWIVNPGNASGTRVFIAVMERATKLISGWTGRVDAAYLHGLGSGGRSTTSVYDELKRRSDDLRQYLGLAGNPTALATALAARRAAGTPGSYTDAAAWSQQIAADLRTLTNSGGNFGQRRNPRLGFLGLHRDLVVALRDAACMTWGAIDFGRRYSGDIMHFDVRRTGLGQALNESGFRTSVPCPAVSTAAGAAAGVAAAGTAAGAAVPRESATEEFPTGRYISGSGLVGPERQAEAASFLNAHLNELQNGNLVRRVISPQNDRRAAHICDVGFFVRGWAMRATSTGRQRIHPAVDISGPINTPVHAIRSGIVEHSAMAGGYGEVILLRHPDGSTSFYAHLDKRLAGRGQLVAGGETIGLMGNTKYLAAPPSNQQYRGTTRDPRCFPQNPRPEDRPRLMGVHLHLSIHGITNISGYPNNCRGSLADRGKLPALAPRRSAVAAWGGADRVSMATAARRPGQINEHDWGVDPVRYIQSVGTSLYATPLPGRAPRPAQMCM